MKSFCRRPHPNPAPGSMPIILCGPTPAPFATLFCNRQSDIHLRGVQSVLQKAISLDPSELTKIRPPKSRVASRCSNFNLLLVSVLRTHGIPARLRCGYANYFNPGYFEDHWVCEYWDTNAALWKLADAQFDVVWKRNLGIRHDVTELPAGAFLNSAQTRQKCRTGAIDPNKVGIHFVGLYGLSVAAGSLIRDFAALARREMLPWDVWGGHPSPI